MIRIYPGSIILITCRSKSYSVDIRLRVRLECIECRMQHLYSSKISLDSLKDVLLKHLGENGRWERLNIYSTEAFNHARGPTLFFSSMAAHQSSYTTLFFLQHRVLVGGPLE